MLFFCCFAMENIDKNYFVSLTYKNNLYICRSLCFAKIS